ncbi:MAG: ABC transporter permease [Candidatus Cryptobacteroides sp.]|nr:ABC transporter permease [Bacteroidales bacterium]MDY2878095.1 ABC transporter permease [Candidatus Cryptobacteroides sp.]
MNLHRINIIIGREYLNRVKKKSFLIVTFLVPVLFAALCMLPALIINGLNEESKTLAVVDESSVVMPYLQDSELVSYKDCTGRSVEELKAELGESDYDAILAISPLDTVARTVSADIFSLKPLGIELGEIVNSRINDAVEAYRISTYDIEDLKVIMEEVKADVKLRSYTLDEEGKETINESGVFMIVSMVLGMIIYMFIVIFGGMVMSSVIEEKSSRVVEVLVSSVKATELMFGKIIGIALVAITQFLLWVVLTAAIIGIVGSIAGPSLLADADPATMVQMSAGVDAAQAEAIASAMSEPGEMSVILTTLKNMPIATILVCFLVFFVFGYMLYASLFAAIGSAVENEGDTQQLQIPVTIPILIGFFIAIYAFKAPESPLVFWGSMIPFTSPIVMLARLPFGVPAWEIIVSIVLLIATVVLCAWISAKIYRVGILVFGKKSTFKDLWKWFKQD